MLLSACASVLATMKSTPSISAAIMLAMALPPAPPTPTTVMRGRSSSTEGGPILMLIPCSPRGGVDIRCQFACGTKHPAPAKGKRTYPQPATRSKIFLHRRPDPLDERETGDARGG